MSGDKSPSRKRQAVAKTSPMTPGAAPVGKILSINEIAPLDFKNADVEASYQDAIAHMKNPHMKDILYIRTKIQQLITNMLISKGYVHPPVHMFSPCADPLNHKTDTPSMLYYGQQVTLMQSLIFHKMLICALTNVDDVFWISPNIRKEMNVGDPCRYATEFTQIDFESTHLDMTSAMALIEEVLKHVVNTLADEDGKLIEKISLRKLPKITGKMKSYDAEDEAVKRKISVTKVEATLAAEEPHPFFLTNLKREAYDRRDDSTGKYLNYDVIFPVIGEVLSGAEREHTYERLQMRMVELSYPLPYFEPVLRVAKEVGLKKTAGAGFGVERLVRGVLLLDDLKKVYPFPRVPEKRIVF
jgi:asparaginyl-tRNA synthetase